MRRQRPSGVTLVIVAVRALVVAPSFVRLVANQRLQGVGGRRMSSPGRPKGEYRRAQPAGTPESGLSLVELMVGLAIGLFIVAGTLSLFANQVSSSRQLLQQARLHQEMRSAMDLVTRDLRRAGAWDNAVLGTVSGAAARPNRYQPIAVFNDAPGADRIEHQFTRDAARGGSENDTVDGYELFGFRLVAGVLQMRLGGAGYQPLTDPAAIRVNRFTISNGTLPRLQLTSACRGTCAGAACPTLTVRQFTLTMEAELANDNTVKRTLGTTVRPRNDAIDGACP
jgi:type IV pilus assembly protein PilW